MKKTILFTLLLLIFNATFAQNPLLKDYPFNMKVWGYLISTNYIDAPKIYTDTIIYGDVVISIDTIAGKVKISGGDLEISNPNAKFTINGSDMFKNQYDPAAYGANTEGSSDATAYFNAKCPGGDCYSVFNPKKGTYQIDGTVNFEAYSVLLIEPKTYLRGYGELVGNNTIIPSGINWQWIDTTITISGTWIVEEWKPVWWKGGSMYDETQLNAVDSICTLLNSDTTRHYGNHDFVGELLQNGASISGGDGISDAADDNRYNTRKGRAWVEADHNSVTKFRNPQYYLAYYYEDLFDAFYGENINAGNANILMMGDSYGRRYVRRIKYDGGDIYGYGGGYMTAEHYTMTYDNGSPDQKIYDLVATDWERYTDRADINNFHGRRLSATSNGEYIYLSAKKYNQVKVNYRQASWGGSFTIKLGINGVLRTVNTSGADSNIFVLQDFGKLCQFPQDTVYVEMSAGDSVQVYGWSLENTYDHSDYGDIYKRKNNISVHDASDGGSHAGNFYKAKDTAIIRTFLEGLDISLMIFTTLDLPGEAPREEIDSLLRLCQYIKPDMSIFLICPNDNSTELPKSQRYFFDSLAYLNNWAYLDFNNIAGSYADLAGSSLITDGTHLSTSGEYLTWLALQKIIYPYPERYENLDVEELTVMNGVIRMPNTESIFINTKNDSSDFDLKDTKSTVIGYDAGTRLTPSTTANTLLGYRAGYIFADYNYNTHIGAYAGEFCDGGENTYIGYETGGGSSGAPSTGIQNTAIGKSAATTAQTTAALYTVIGAGSGLVTNSSTVYIGARTGRVNTGMSNVAIGKDCLYSSGTGTLNTFIGMESARDLSNGSSNTAAGYRSFYNNTIGDDNVMIGAKSGYNNIIGNRNVFIGNQAGYNETGSDKLYIENSDRSTPLIYGDFATEDVKINGDLQLTTKTPSSASDTGIAGTICWDANYIYICTATNTWKRVAISTW